VSDQIYFEDVVEGQQISPLEKEITTINMLMYLAAVWLMDRIHFDYLYATERRGLPNVVAPGTMGVDYFAQLLHDWAGEKGELRKLSVQYRKFMLPGDILTCGGKIIRKYTKEENGFVELELSLINQKGIICALGIGTVNLPSREREKT
jgi:acyl dehydratase